MNSQFLSLSWKDVVKGFVVSAVSGVITAVYAALTTVPPTFDFKQIGIVGLTAGVAYLMQKFVTNSNGDLAKKEQ